MPFRGVGKLQELVVSHLYDFCSFIFPFLFLDTIRRRVGHLDVPVCGESFPSCPSLLLLEEVSLGLAVDQLLQYFLLCVQLLPSLMSSSCMIKAGNAALCEGRVQCGRLGGYLDLLPLRYLFHKHSCCLQLHKGLSCCVLFQAFQILFAFLEDVPPKEGCITLSAHYLASFVCHF